MNLFNKIFFILSFFHVLGSSCPILSQNVYEYRTKEGWLIYSVRLELKENGEYTYSEGGSCSEGVHSYGEWEILGDSLILNSNALEINFLKITEESTGTEGIEIVVRGSYHNNQKKVSTLDVIAGFPFEVYSNGQKIECLTDSLGTYMNLELSKVDSLNLGDLLIREGEDLVMILEEEEINRIEILINMNKHVEFCREYLFRKELINDIWLIHGDTLINEEQKLFRINKRN